MDAKDKETAKDTKKIKFLESCNYLQMGPNGQPDPAQTLSYAAGTTYEVDNSAGHADRWIRRGKAVEVDAKEVAKPKVIAVEKAKDEKAADAPEDYEAMTAEELHKIAADRNLEGRGGLNKADTVKLIEKDDRKKAAAPPKK